MCGIGGWIRLDASASVQRKLAMKMGHALDSRGGHACGYFAVPWHCGEPKVVRSTGEFAQRKPGWYRHAYGRDVVMHSRYATGPNRTIVDAHPFTVWRGLKPVLVGVHNGVLNDAHRSAWQHGRRIRVDSQEALELIADGENPALLNGWGVVVWYEYSGRKLRMMHLQRRGELCFRKFMGGLLFASTERILDAVEFDWPIVPEYDRMLWENIGYA